MIYKDGNMKVVRRRREEHMGRAALSALLARDGFLGTTRLRAGIFYQRVLPGWAFSLEVSTVREYSARKRSAFVVLVRGHEEWSPEVPLYYVSLFSRLQLYVLRVLCDPSSLS